MIQGECGRIVFLCSCFLFYPIIAIAVEEQFVGKEAAVFYYYSCNILSLICSSISGYSGFAINFACFVFVVSGLTPIRLK